MLFFLAACVSCFLLPHARFIVETLGSERFSGAENALTILLLYPVLTVYGRTVGALYYAMEKTKLYSLICTFTTFFPILLTYYLVAPVDFPLPGLGLGSYGLALKYLLAGTISVLSILYFAAGFSGVSFFHHLGFQLKTLFMLGALAYLGYDVVALLLSGDGWWYDFSRFILEGILYLGAVIFLLFRFPSLAGITQEEIFGKIAQLRKKFQHKL